MNISSHIICALNPVDHFTHTNNFTLSYILSRAHLLLHVFTELFHKDFAGLITADSSWFKQLCLTVDGSYTQCVMHTALYLHI